VPARAAVVLLCALAGCGDDAPGARAYEDARRSLDAGELRRAAELAAEAARAGDESIAVLGLFLSGNVAFARCVRAERQAAGPGAEPFALDLAIRHGERARDLWIDAAMTRADWPAARRNVERALLKLRELEREKAEREPDREKADPEPKPKPQPRRPPPLPRAGDKEEVVKEPVPPLDELPAAEVAKLLERLARKEGEKRALRREEREKKSAPVERDW